MPNESVDKARFWLFSESQVFDFIDSEFMENAFSPSLNVEAHRSAIYGESGRAPCYTVLFHRPLKVH